MKSKTKSPLKDKPLRYVAQSGDEAIEDLLYDKVLWHYSVVIILAMQLGYESTGKNYEPFPVVLFPGWFVNGNGNTKGKQWVLEPKAFRKFFR